MNSTDETNSTPADLIAVSVVQISAQVIAAIGNLLVLVTFCACKSLHKTQNAFSVNMAVSDLQAGLFTIKVVSRLRNNPYGDYAGCEFFVCYAMVIVLVSALSVLCAALDRFVALKYALRYYMIVTKGKVLLTIGLIWVISAVIGFAPLYRLSKGEINKRLELGRFCGGKVITTVPFYTVVAVGVLVPVAVTVCSVYLYIYKVVRRHEGHQAGQTVGQANSQHHQKAISVSKSARIFLFICLIMVVCWLPFAMTLLFVPADQIPSSPIAAISSLVFLPHALNPWIYTLRNAEFREATKKIFQKSYRKFRGCLRGKTIRVAPTEISLSQNLVMPVTSQQSTW